MTQALRERFVDCNGIRLHVVECGPADGPLVLMLHGFPEFWRCWKDYMRPLADQGYLVVAPDQRGYNTSDKPKSIAAYRVDVLCQDLLDLIQHYGRDRVRLVAHDWGGVIAWRLISEHPQVIERCIIINAPHPIAFRQHYANSWEQKRKSWYMVFFQIPGLPEWLLRQGNCALLRRTLAKAKENPYGEQDFAKYLAAWRIDGAMTAMLNWYRAMLRHPVQSSQQLVKPPVRIIWGTADHALSTPLGPLSLKQCERGELIPLEGVSHWAPRERPREILGLIQEFFTKDLGKSRPSTRGMGKHTDIPSSV